MEIDDSAAKLLENVVVKLALTGTEGNVVYRRIRLAGCLDPYEKLKRRAVMLTLDKGDNSEFDLKDYKVTCVYADVDGDQVMIESIEDLLDAFRQYESSGSFKVSAKVREAKIQQEKSSGGAAPVAAASADATDENRTTRGPIVASRPRTRTSNIAPENRLYSIYDAPEGEDDVPSASADGPNANIKNEITDVGRQPRLPYTDFTLHNYGGGVHILPESWRFPSCDTLTLWKLWNLGDEIKQIPPLKMLDGKDVGHLDKLPLEEGQKRRKANKVLHDLRYLMTFVEQKVQELGHWTDRHNSATVVEMFRKVEHYLEYESNGRRRQAGNLKWQTAVHIVRKIVKDEYEASSGRPNEFEP